jgi:hypothetical protein
MTAAVVVESKDLTIRDSSALATPTRLVKVVTQVDDEVVLILPGSVTVGVEVAVGCTSVSGFQLQLVESRDIRKLLQEKTAKLSSETSSFSVGAVLVRPTGLFTSEPQTLNW